MEKKYDEVSTQCHNDKKESVQSSRQILPQGKTVTEKLAWIEANVQNNSTYLVEITDDEKLNPHELSYEGKNNITIILEGNSSKPTISLTSSGSLFKIENGVHLILNNLSLHGIRNNNSSLIWVGGNLTMNIGSAVLNNQNIGYDFEQFGRFVLGGGITICGLFTMNGGIISGNSSGIGPKLKGGKGGGVYVCGDGKFVMNEGEITLNKSAMGGGIVITENGKFTLCGGSIEKNLGLVGGGICVQNGLFMMEGGMVSKNQAQGYGGGVLVMFSKENNWFGDFNKTGGTIIGYTSNSTNGNISKDNEGVVNKWAGHSIAGMGDGSVVKKFKNTTSAPTDDMYFKAATQDFSGIWDKDESSKNTSGGCYIATCVYGSYDCSEVLILRYFRDNHLAKSWLGRMFIQVYYVISPKLVSLFGDKEWFHSLFKRIINSQVKRLSQK